MDYFFDIFDVATVLNVDREASLTKPLKPFPTRRMTNFNGSDYCLEKRIAEIVVNISKPSESHNLNKMLQAAKWLVLKGADKQKNGDSALVWVYFPPEKVVNGITKYNYKLNWKENRDYFVGDDGLYTYFMVRPLPSCTAPLTMSTDSQSRSLPS